MTKLINRFFWFFAGSDPDILKKCSNAEKTKHFGLGATVLITAIIATLSGTYAIRTLSESFGWSLVFGVFWGFVILNIDRLLVSTMKKRIDNNKWKEALFSIPRIILAMAIALVISKPVEVKILENQIDKQLAYDKVEELKQLNQLNMSAFSIDDSKEERTNAEKNMSALTEETLGITNEASYKDIEDNEKKCIDKATSIQKQIDGKSRAIINLRSDGRYWKQVEIFKTNDGREYTEPYPPGLTGDIELVSVRSDWAKNQMMNINSEIRKLRKEMPKCIQYLKSKNEYVKIRKTDIYNQKEILKSRRNKADKRIEEVLENWKNQTQKDSAIIEKSGKNLFGMLIALENAKYKSVSNLDTLSNGEIIADSNSETNMMRDISLAIMFFFFILEICPILVKIMSNRGPYDEILETQELLTREKERKLQADIKSQTESEISIMDGKNVHLRNSELDTSQELMDQIKSAQLDLAKEVVTKWKQQKLSELDSNPSKFIKNVVTD